MGVGTLGIGKHENATTEDISLNIKWNATEKLFFEFDAQLTKADADYVEVWGGGTFFANVFAEPDLENPTSPNSASTRGTGINHGNTRRWRYRHGCRLRLRPTDPNDAYWLFASDSFREGTGELNAFRADRGTNSGKTPGSRPCVSACATPSVSRTTRKSA